MACLPPSSGAGVVGGSRPLTHDPERGSGVGLASSQDKRDSGQAWPLSSYLELGALPSAVPCARLHAKQVLWEWNLDSLTETIELIVSELVTNAQRASAGRTSSQYRGQRTPGVPPVRLWLQADTERALIQIWDGDHHLPEPQTVDLTAEGGRGLLLVEALSAKWGAYLLEGSSGKVVWAVVSAEPSEREGGWE